jgi:hypothetical protein
MCPGCRGTSLLRFSGFGGRYPRRILYRRVLYRSQAYSFNRFTLFEAIEKNAMAGGKVIEFFPGQKISKDIDQGVGPACLKRICRR